MAADGATRAGMEETVPEAGGVDADVVPLLYELLRSVERDSHDTAAKARDSHECSHRVLQLRAKLDTAREQIRRLPGIEYNKQEQLRQFEILRNQLHLKQELLQKYRNMYSFDTSFQ